MTVLYRKLRRHIVPVIAGLGTLCLLLWIFQFTFLNVSPFSPASQKSIGNDISNHKSVEANHAYNLQNQIDSIIHRPLTIFQKNFSSMIKARLLAAPPCHKCQLITRNGSKWSNSQSCTVCDKPNFPLLGNIKSYYKSSQSLSTVIHDNMDVKPGGMWSSNECSPNEAVAIIIPFRDRWKQLSALLSVLHPMLRRQKRCYRVFLVEQYGCQAFNKGQLNNVGFLEVAKIFRFDCVIFQDTDIIPEHDHNFYSCPGLKPRHMAVALDTYKYRLPYSALVGGVIAFSVDHYLRINGYSNLYWGWGLEDDDMELRMKVGSRLGYVRPSIKVARYWAYPHKSQHIFKVQGSRRKPLLKSAIKRFRKDGVNSVHYSVLFTRNEALFTHFLVRLDDPPEDFDE